MRVVTTTIAAPVAELNARAHRPRHVEVNLTARQGEGLQILRDGLYERSARLANGKPIASNADAIRWWLEQLPEALMSRDIESGPGSNPPA